MLFFGLPELDPVKLNTNSEAVREESVTVIFVDLGDVTVADGAVPPTSHAKPVGAFNRSVPVDNWPGEVSCMIGPVREVQVPEVKLSADILDPPVAEVIV